MDGKIISSSSDERRKWLLGRYEKFGFKWFSEVYWTTSLPVSALEALYKFLEEQDIYTVLPSLAKWPPEATRTRWAFYFNESREFIGKEFHESIPDGSMALRLTSMFRSERERDASEPAAVNVAAAIRFAFGASAAGEFITLQKFDAWNLVGLQRSELAVTLGMDMQPVGGSEGQKTPYFSIRKFSVEVATLFDAAMAQRPLHQRFVLMWLAYEALTTELAGEVGGGQWRKSFFADLGSELVSQEARRIREDRNKAFHEGRLEGIDFSRGLLSLYTIMQIMLIDSGHQREALVGMFESELIAMV